jgi:hypothetical protein
MSSDVADLSMPAVESEITSLAGHLAAGTCRFLELLAVFDTGGGWHGTGMQTCAQWLSWKCGLSSGTARDQLRVAHALDGLPAVRAAFAAGRLSYSKARALTRVATPDDEAALVQTATACTASQLDRLCAGIAKARSNEEVIEQAARASFTTRWEADGTLRLSGRLSAEDGAVLLAALAAVRPDPVSDTDTSATAGTHPADAATVGVSPNVDRPDAAARAAHSDAAALVGLAEHALSDPPAAVGTSPIRLVVHTSAELFSAGIPALPVTTKRVSAETPTVAVLDAGPHIPPLPLGPDTLRRLACQALVEPASHPDTEPPTAVQHRFASARQRRALLQRDGGCVFTGCRRRRGLQAHHLVPWHDHGPTTMANLALICEHHHRLVHEGGWRLRPRPDYGFDAVRPDGHVLRPAPATHGTAGHLPAVHDAAIAPTTVTGTWSGERLELDYAVSVYTQRTA